VILAGRLIRGADLQKNPLIFWQRLERTGHGNCPKRPTVTAPVFSELVTWTYSRLLPANSLNHTHKEVVAEKLYSLSVGIFSSGGNNHRSAQTPHTLRMGIDWPVMSAYRRSECLNQKNLGLRCMVSRFTRHSHKYPLALSPLH
jgi:hypothetical protein